MARILLIDDDESILRASMLYLRAKGHEVFATTDSEAAVALARQVQPEVLVTDLMMPRLMGGGVYEAVRREFGPDLPVIISSGMHLKLHADDPRLFYCPKPLDLDRLLECIEQALKPS